MVLGREWGNLECTVGTFWDFPKLRGTLFWGPYNKDPTIQGSIFWGPLFSGNPPYVRDFQGLAQTHGSSLGRFAEDGIGSPRGSSNMSRSTGSPKADPGPLKP